MSLHLQSNRQAAGVDGPGAVELGLLDPDASARARQVIAGWPIYHSTPTIALRGLAQELGVRAIWVKDESHRLPLRSFKQLGAAYALAMALSAREAWKHVPLNRYFQADWPSRVTDAGFRAVAATDGNHGNALAWASRLLGVGCSIYVPHSVSSGREQAILRHGVSVVRVDGTYDDAVRQVFADAVDNGWTVIQDTALRGFEQHCRDILYGYTMLMQEACDQMAPSVPTHIFVQAGVGGLAASVSAYAWERFAAARPSIVVVQSEKADPVFQSIRTGSLTAVAGPHETMMGGIACGEMSAIAWETLRHTTDHVASIDDDTARDTLRICSEGVGADPPLQIGETGIAGLAALRAVARDPNLARQLRIDANSTVLAFITEGITDPQTHARFLNAGL